VQDGYKFLKHGKAMIGYVDYYVSGLESRVEQQYTIITNLQSQITTITNLLNGLEAALRTINTGGNN
jgi:hypothetical protein